MVLLEINILKKEKSFTYIKNNKYKAYCIDGIQYLALGVKPYIINNALRKDNMGVFKFIVINDKIE